MRVRAGLLGLALLGLSAGVTGCGTASDPSPPAGVDQLEIPTPAPDPDDFREGLDNPWFPSSGGGPWTYQVTDASGSHRMRVSVCGTEDVDGVATTAVCTTEPGRNAVDYYAEDDDGNVWWFGREGEWEAGVDGAEAGVAMLARPRVGDGYYEGYRQGVVEDRATVLAVDDTVRVPAGSFGGVVRITVSSALQPGRTTVRLSAPGLGLVEEADGSRVVRLVSAAPSS